VSSVLGLVTGIAVSSAVYAITPSIPDSDVRYLWLESCGDASPLNAVALKGYSALARELMRHPTAVPFAQVIRVPADI
jgi:hypothetical protein